MIFGGPAKASALQQHETLVRPNLVGLIPSAALLSVLAIVLSLTQTPHTEIRVPKTLTHAQYRNLFISTEAMFGTDGVAEGHFGEALQARWDALSEDTEWVFLCGHLVADGQWTVAHTLRSAFPAGTSFHAVGGMTLTDSDLALVRTTKREALRAKRSLRVDVCEPVPLVSKIAPELLDDNSFVTTSDGHIDLIVTHRGPSNTHATTTAALREAVSALDADAAASGHPRRLLERLGREASPTVIRAVRAPGRRLDMNPAAMVRPSRVLSANHDGDHRGEARVRVHRSLAASVSLQIALDVPSLDWIGQTESYTVDNDDASALQQGYSGTGRNDLPGPGNTFAHLGGLTGENEIGGISDTFLDTSSCFFNHVNESTTSPKVLKYDTSIADGGQASCAHGTHTSGTMLGNPTAVYVNPRNHSEGNITVNDEERNHRGIAYNAKLVFVNLGGSTAESIDPPSNLLSKLYPIFKDAGSRVVSNSWSSDRKGEVSFYSRHSLQLDRYLKLNSDMLILFSAGNYGQGSKTIGRPSQAKNILTVGASNKDGTTATSAQTSEYAWNKLASYSSVGPSDDGRIKPDIVSSGGRPALISAQSTADGSPSCSTCGKSGTSMATPLVAGGALLLRQYLREGFYPGGSRNMSNAMNEPPGFLLKALIIHSGENLINDDANRQGWGHVNLANILQFSDTTGAAPPSVRASQFNGIPYNYGDCLYMNATGKLQQGESQNYVFDLAPTASLTSGDIQFKATITWYDFEAAVNSDKTLINDLELTVAVLDSNDNVVSSEVLCNHRDNVAVIYKNVPVATPRVRVTVKAVYIWQLTFIVKPQKYALVATARSATCTSGLSASEAAYFGSQNGENYVSPLMTSLYVVFGLIMIGAWAFLYFRYGRKGEGHWAEAAKGDANPDSRVLSESNKRLGLRMKAGVNTLLSLLVLIPFFFFVTHLYWALAGLALMVYWLISATIFYVSRRYRRCWDYRVDILTWLAIYTIMLTFYFYWFFRMYTPTWYTVQVAEVLEPIVYTAIWAGCFITAANSFWLRRKEAEGAERGWKAARGAVVKSKLHAMAKAQAKAQKRFDKKELKVSLPVGPLGIDLAEFSAPNGQVVVRVKSIKKGANTEGILEVGDEFVTVCGKPVLALKDALAALQTSVDDTDRNAVVRRERAHVSIAGLVEELREAETAKQQTAANQQPTIAEDIEVTLPTGPLGLDLAEMAYSDGMVSVRVNGFKEDSVAKGMLAVGDEVVSVDDLPVSSLNDAIKALTANASDPSRRVVVRRMALESKKIDSFALEVA